MEEAAEGTSEFSEKACGGGLGMPAMTVVSGPSPCGGPRPHTSSSC